MLIDDFTDDVSALGTAWRLVSDRVMGGVSVPQGARGPLAGRPALRLEGQVRLENNGGFIAASLDLAGHGPLLAEAAGLQLWARGNGERYGLHLRTTACRRPWQSYRASFVAPVTWTRVQLPWAAFAPHRLTAPLVPGDSRRVGLYAVGRAFTADVAIADFRTLPLKKPTP